jgi:hypothetical protein
MWAPLCSPATCTFIPLSQTLLLLGLPGSIAAPTFMLLVALALQRRGAKALGVRQEVVGVTPSTH